jgi:hypothetical protein
MISTLTGATAGPVDGYIATGGQFALQMFSRRKNALAIQTFAGPSLSEFSKILRSARFSNNASHLVIGSDTISNVGLHFYQRSGSTFTAASIPGGSLGVQFATVSISSDGEYFSGNNRIYHNNAGSLTFLAAPSGDRGSLSSDGEYFSAVTFENNNTNLKIYKRSGSGNTATYPQHQSINVGAAGGTAFDTRFSDGGAYLALACELLINNTNAKRLIVYKFNSSTGEYETLNQPPTGGTQLDTNPLPSGISWSSDSTLLAVSSSTQTFIYERSGDVFTYRTSLTNQSDIRAGSFHPNGNFYITGRGRLYRKITPSSWTFLQQIGNTQQLMAVFSPNLS